MITVRTLSDLQAELPTIGAWLLTDTENGRTTWKVQDAANASGLAHSHGEAVAAIVAAVNEQHAEPVLVYEAPDPDDAVPLPPLDEKLADWGDLPSLTPDEADAEVARLMSNQAEGFDLADEISGLSQARRNDLTHALHRKKGRMRRERMTGAAPQVEEAAIDHLVDLLARRGV